MNFRTNLSERRKETVTIGGTIHVCAFMLFYMLDRLLMQIIIALAHTHTHTLARSIIALSSNISMETMKRRKRGVPAIINL